MPICGREALHPGMPAFGVFRRGAGAISALVRE